MSPPAVDNKVTASMARIAGAMLGGALVSYGRRRGGLMGNAALVAGVGLIAGAAARPVFEEVVRAGSDRRSVRIRTTLMIDRPVRDVFTFCHDFENFPRVVGMLRRVVDFQDGRSHWEAVTPSGQVLEWDVEVTKYVPNAVIAWRSVAGSPVECTGLIRFTPAAHGGTRLEMELTYRPLETGLADALLALAAAPGEERVREDLTRASSHPPRPARVAAPDESADVAVTELADLPRGGPHPPTAAADR